MKISQLNLTFPKFSIYNKLLLLYYLNYARIKGEHGKNFIPEGIEPPPKAIITSPELQVYVERFRELIDDLGLVAEVDSRIVGAVWVRIMNDYGYLDDKTPSLAISLYKEYRGFGIGTAMMKEILALLKTHGYKHVSLSVQKANYATKLYLKVGFEIVI